MRLKNLNDADLKNFSSLLNDTEAGVFQYVLKAVPSSEPEYLKTISAEKISLEERIQNFEGQITAFSGQLTDKERQINALTATIQGNDGQIRILDGQIANISGQLREKDKQIEELNVTIHKSDEQLSDLESQITDFSGQLKEKEGQINELHVAAQSKDEQLRYLEGQITDFSGQLKEKEGQINELHIAAQSKDEQLRYLEGQITDFSGQLKEKEGQIDELHIAAQSKDEQLRYLEGQITDFSGQLKEKEERIREFERDNLRINNELNSIKSSVTWGTVMKWHSLVEYLIPPMTRRRRWYDLSVIGLRTITNEGWNRFWWKYKEYRQKKKIRRDAQSIEQRNYKKTIPRISYGIKSRSASYSSFIKKIRKFVGTEGYVNLAKRVIFLLRLSIKKKYGIIHLKFVSMVCRVDKQQECIKTLEDAPCLCSVSEADNSSDKVACTIVSKNYLPMAFVLAKSFKSNNPDWDFKILLCDMIESADEFRYILNREVKVIPLYSLLTHLKIDELEAMCFKYTVIEMNTAIKPYFIEYLFKQNYEKVVYLDPDILVLQKFDEIDSILNTHNVALIPHIITPLPNDNKRPSELDIIRAGAYNLGFIALKKTEDVIKLLNWWQNKLKDYCFMNVEAGMHVDQKWIDFVPAFFDSVCVLKKKNYNVAYWNLHERKVWKKGNTWVVDNDPLIFFHFSGFMIDDLKDLSKHQNRYSLADFPAIKELFVLYRNLLIGEGMLKFKSKKYWFDYLPGTGIKIPPFLRTCYNDILPIIDNPYNPNNVSKIINMANESVIGDPDITRLWYEIYNKRNDLQEAFSNLKRDKNNRLCFIEWVKTSGKREHDLNEIFVKPLDNNKISTFTNDKVGINLYGYFGGVFGVAEVSRVLFKTLLLMGIPFCLLPLESKIHEKLMDVEITRLMSRYLSQVTPYFVNLILVNADELPLINRRFGPEKFENKYNIGLWAWELEDYFPFKESFEFIDEIWYFSEFACKTYRKHTTKPVIKITYPYMPTWNYVIDRDIIRKKFGIENNDFVFFLDFDFHSSFERKNPEGVIEAFIAAFPKKDEDVTLVLKTLHADFFPNEKKRLKRRLHGDDRIIWIDKVFTKEELISLKNASDSYISLHRSEGLGIGLIDAMYLGKCVIATSYGGNLEFMNTENSFLVDYSLTDIKEDFGPYKKGKLWADPEIDQASDFMRQVYKDRDLAKEKGKKAAADIRKNLNPEKTVLEIFRRLDKIQKM
jgi:glycosyltransferase involved in cell wall biosynthesis/peptidoglycan hydrolase CwlO-like protein